MCEHAHFARFFLVNELQWIEVLHFRCEGDWEVRGIEAGDRRHAALAGQQVLPQLWRGVAGAGNES